MMRLAEELLMTTAGLQRLHGELELLRRQRDFRINETIESDGTPGPGDPDHPLLQGDIMLLDRRISYLEGVLQRARAVPSGEIGQEVGVVGIGNRVVVRWEDGAEESYLLVGPPEVDLNVGRISYESPVGRALMGKRRGESVSVETPSGLSQLQILMIQ